MSAVFLAKVEIKEKEDSAKNKGNDINGENKTMKKMVCFYLLLSFCLRMNSLSFENQLSNILEGHPS